MGLLTNPYWHFLLNIRVNYSLINKLSTSLMHNYYTYFINNLYFSHIRDEASLTPLNLPGGNATSIAHCPFLVSGWLKEQTRHAPISFVFAFHKRALAKSDRGHRVNVALLREVLKGFLSFRAASFFLRNR